jgi:SAM-dependent methyltransferase
MPSWLIKNALHRAICWLPYRSYWNRLLQQFSGSLRLTPETFDSRLEEFGRQRQIWQKSGSPVESPRIVELGTGWFPILPIAHGLCGAARLDTFDIDPLVTRGQLATTLQYFVTAAESGKLDGALPGWRKEELPKLKAVLSRVTTERPAALLAELGIHLHVRDAQNSKLEPGSVDFIYSSAVLEYIHRPVLDGILREFRRIARQDAVMIHRVNFRDVFSYCDGRLTPFNMLRYSARAWRWLDSPMTPQNRLRVSDYRSLLLATGWKIIDEQNENGSLDALRSVPLADPFRGHSETDLLVIESWLTARPA